MLRAGRGWVPLAKRYPAQVPQPTCILRSNLEAGSHTARYRAGTVLQSRFGCASHLTGNRHNSEYHLRA